MNVKFLIAGTILNKFWISTVCMPWLSWFTTNMSFDDVASVTVTRNNLGFIFGVWLTGKGVCRIKISDLKEKVQKHVKKKKKKKKWKVVFYILLYSKMENITPEIKSPQKRTMIKVKKISKIINAIIKKVGQKKLSSISETTRKSYWK